MTVFSETRRAFRVGFGRIVPPICVACAVGLEVGSAPICRVCFSRLPPMNPPHCPRCGATQVGEFWIREGCSECETWGGKGLRARAPFRMQGLAQRLVHELKYGGWQGLAPPMGGAMVPAARQLAAGERVTLVPVPLGPARLRERRFNQAELLALAIAAHTGWPVAPLLQRGRSGPRQARLGRGGRAANVRRAYAVNRSADRPAGPVLLVDDVVTTGATAGTCTGELTAAGLRVVGVVSFARSVSRIEGSAPPPTAPFT